MHADFDPAPRLPVSRGERSVVLALAVAFTALLVADLCNGFNQQKLGAVFVLLLWLPMLGLHALGHALAARLMGWRLIELGVGFGRELWRFRLGAICIRLSTLPLEAYALARAEAPGRTRLGRAVFYLGGPLANLLVLGVSALALRWPEPRDGLALIAIQSLALTAALGLYPLLPYRSSGHPSDGLALLECLFASADTLRERQTSAFVQRARRSLYDEQPALAREWLEQGLAQLPGEPRLMGLLAVVRSAEGDPQGAYAALEELGPPDEREPALRAELIADAAWAVLQGHDETLLPDAQRAAERAALLCPDEPHYALSSGWVAFERGRFEEAYAHLMGAYVRTRDADQEAQCVAYLALTCRALQHAAGVPPFVEQAARFEAAVRARAIPARLRQRVLDGVPHAPS